MGLASDLALEHQRRRTVTTNRATVSALRVWRTINPQELDAGWDVQAPQMIAGVTSAQVTAAKQATSYMNRVDRFYGRTSDTGLVAEAFGGVTLDGRDIGPAMFGAVTTTKTLTRRLGAQSAFEVGASFLATVIGAAVQDMGRQADNTLATGRTYTRYVRVVNAGACSRCAILAGKASYETAFLRHPRCKCTTWPIESPDGDSPVPEGLFASPSKYFESLSPAEQSRVFTNAGAEAIRLGANPTTIVNARRGAYGIEYSGHYNIPVATGTRNTLRPITIGLKADGSPLQVFATTEGRGSRGQFGGQNFTGGNRRSSSIRLMPEQIMRMSKDPERIRELLQRYGYLN